MPCPNCGIDAEHCSCWRAAAHNGELWWCGNCFLHFNDRGENVELLDYNETDFALKYPGKIGDDF